MAGPNTTQITSHNINPDFAVGVDVVAPFFIFVSGSQARVRTDGTAELGEPIESYFETNMTEPTANTQAAPELEKAPEAAETPAISPRDEQALDAMHSRKSEPPPPDKIEVVSLELPAQVEALLYVAGEPVPVSTLAQALDVQPKEIEAALETLEERFRNRGVRLQRAANKLQLVSAPEMATRVQKFLGLEAINKLSPAALETLAIIAYKQPITRPQLEMIRGVNSDGVMHTLIQRNLVQELGRADSVGYPMRYGVSFEFLQHFGLKSTRELPQIENIETVTLAEEATHVIS